MKLEDWNFLPPALRSERRVLCLLLLVSLLLRIGAAIAGTVITHDGACFTYRARLVDEARLGEVMAVWPHMPPLYPLFIHLAARFLPDLGTAGAAVSVLFGTLALLPLHALTRGIAGERIAAVTALLYAFLPQVALLGGEVMSESLFLFFFLGWMALLWSATREPHWTRFALAGVAGAAAYMTRVEGIYTLLGTVGWCLLVCRRSLLRIAAGAACFLAVFLVLSWPYLLWVKAQTGRWGFTANPFAGGVLARLKGDPPPPPAKEMESFANPEDFKEHRAYERYGKFGGALFMVLRESIKVFFYVFLPIGLLGLFLARRAKFDGWGMAFLLLLVFGYTIPTIVGQLTGAPFGYRYILPACVFALPFVAVGTLQVLSWAARVRWLPAVLSAAVLVAMTVKVVKPRDREKIGIREAGLWIRREHGTHLRIAAMDRRIEHYAFAHYVLVPPRFDELPRDVKFVVLYTPRIGNLEPGFMERVEAEFVEVTQFHHVRIFAPR